MKNIWEELITFKNLEFAFLLARKGKRNRKDVASYEYHLEENLIELQHDLRNGTYLPGSYHNFWIHDPKKRLISAASFRDRVVHHALHNMIGPIFEQSMIFDSYANRIGKGTHPAIDRCTRFLRKYSYVLLIDIKQYFPSIDHEILLNEIGRKISDEKVLSLCRKILESGNGILAEAYDMQFFPEDNLFSVFRPRGLPIGNLTSQFWANVYLMRFDHWVKRDLRIPGYIRYVDDMVFFSDSKPQLNSARNIIISHLSDLRLTIHENSAQVRPTRIGIPFLGFQIFPDHRMIKKRKSIYAQRKLRQRKRQWLSGTLSSEKMKASVEGWLAHISHGDTYGLKSKIYSEYKHFLKGTISSG